MIQQLRTNRQIPIYRIEIKAHLALCCTAASRIAPALSPDNGLKGRVRQGCRTLRRGCVVVGIGILDDPYL